MINLAPLPQTPVPDPAPRARPAPDDGSGPGLSFADALDRAGTAVPAQEEPAGAAHEPREDLPASDAPDGPTDPVAADQPPAGSAESAQADAPPAASQPAPPSTPALAIDGLNQLLLLNGGRAARIKPGETNAPPQQAAAAAQPETAGGSADGKPRARSSLRSHPLAALLDTKPPAAPAESAQAAPAANAGLPAPPVAPAAGQQPPPSGSDEPAARPGDGSRSNASSSAAPPAAGAAPARPSGEPEPARPAAPMQVLRIVAAPAHPAANGGAGHPGHGHLPLTHAPAPAAAPAGVETQQDLLAAQLSRILAGAAARAGGGEGGDTMTVRLTPETLGAMTIRVDLRDGAVSASFAAQTAQARDLLESSLTVLRSALEARGLTVERLAVELTPAAPQQQSDSPDRQAAERPPHNDAGGGSADGRSARHHARDGGRGGPYTDDARAGTDADAGATSHAHDPPPTSVSGAWAAGGLLLGIDALA